MIFRAFGMWSSRDNVFSSPFEPNCPKGNCTSPDFRLQNVAAVLAGGPYGPSDGIGRLNKQLIMRSCRSDGVLLKVSRDTCRGTATCHSLSTAAPQTLGLTCSLLLLKADRPLATTDAELLTKFSADHSGRSAAAAGAFRGHVWATHSALPGAGPKNEDEVEATWHYVLSVDTTADLPLTVADLTSGGGGGEKTGGKCDYMILDFWASNGSAPSASSLSAVKSGAKFIVPTSPPPSVVVPPSSSGTYQVLSPVLPGGWCLLGEAEKIVSASNHRFSALSASANGSTFSVGVSAASGEAVAVWVLLPAATHRLLASTSATAGEDANVNVKAGLQQVLCRAPKCEGEDCATAMRLSCIAEPQSGRNSHCICAVG